MCSEWEEVVLADVVKSANTGLDAIRRAPIVEQITGIKCLRIQDISQKKKYEDWGFTDVTDDNFEKFKLRVGDIVVARTGATIGVNRVISRDYNSVYNNGLIRIIINDEIANYKFIYYSMQTNLYKSYINGISSGTSTQPNMKIRDFLSFKFSLPSLPEQESIVMLLESIDNKIENNNKMNIIIEELAQTLFKRWFVDFEFPNEDGKPYMSSGGKMKDSEVGMIPENWKSIKLSEIANFFNGFSYKSIDLGDSKTGMLTIKNFKRCGGYNSEGFREISDNSRVKDFHFIKIFDIIVAHTDITQNADIIGNPILITNLGEYENMIYSMDIVKVTSRNEESHENFFIYGQLKSRRFKEHALSYTNGTTVLHLSKDALKTYNIAIPSDEKIIDKYNKLVGNLYRIISKNEIKNNRLTKLRETLLPKLMSGEIRVPIDKD